MKCIICETRKARRHCPGVRGEICSICCGTERENTVDCPFECVHLQEARLFEKPVEIEPGEVREMAFQEIRVPDRFLEDHPNQAAIVMSAVTQAILEAPAVVDFDVREALEALIRTYKTLQSGLIYDARPTNPLAARIYDDAQKNIAENRKALASEIEITLRDSEILIALVILHRREFFYNNLRRRGRAFIDHLRGMFPEMVPENPTTSSLIV